MLKVTWMCSISEYYGITNHCAVGVFRPLDFFCYQTVFFVAPRLFCLLPSAFSFFFGLILGSVPSCDNHSLEKEVLISVSIPIPFSFSFFLFDLTYYLTLP